MKGSPRHLMRRAAAALLRGLIRAYQLGPAYFFQGSCRYEPGCSRYATEAVAMHGPFKGSWLAVRRVCRCHPWGGMGYDPVPAPAARRASTGELVDVVPGRLPTAPPRAPRALEF